MVKYGKYLRSSLISEWADSYINYKLLKQSLKSSQSINNSLLTTFTSLLESEFKKVYLFFVSMERELYIKLNTQLYHRRTYSKLSTADLHREANDLCIIIFIAVCLNRFINQNVTTMLKITKKFDKKHKATLGLMSLNFFKSKLDNKNTDLEYLLQFKVIDETSALVEELVKEIRLYLNLKPKASAQIDEIKSKLDETLTYVTMIDMENYYNVKYPEWLYYIRKGKRIVKNNPSTYQNDIYNPMLSSALIEDNVMCKLLRENAKEEYIKGECKLSCVNKVNVGLCLLLVFLTGCVTGIFIPSLYKYCKSSSNGDYLIWFGLIWTLTPLCSFLSIFIFRPFGYRHYKLNLLLSCSILIIGSILYSFHNHITYVIIGRVLLGLSSNQITIRRYITQYVTKNLLSIVSMLYVVFLSTGVAFGALIGLISTVLPVYSIIAGFIEFNALTYPGWFLAFLSFTTIILILILFTSPTNASFTMMTKEKVSEFTGEKLSLYSSANGRDSEDQSNPLISEAEKEMILKVDLRLDEFNQKNIFDDLNRVPHEIRRAVRHQSYKSSYSSKAFMTLSMISMVSACVIEMVLMQISKDITLIKHDISWVHGCIVILLELLPFLTWFSLQRIMQRKLDYAHIILSILLFLQWICSLVFISFDVNSSKGFFYKDIILMLLLIICLIVTVIIEILVGKLFSLVFPPQWKIMKLGTGLLLTSAIYIGKIIAGILYTFRYNIITVIVISLCSIVSIMLVIINRKSMVNKALCRIISNQLVDKF